MTGQVQRDVEDTPEAIELCFPGWHVWRTRRGEELANWAASRLWSDVGVSRTVICDSPSALRVALEYEAKLAARPAMPRLVVARRVIFS